MYRLACFSLGLGLAVCVSSIAQAQSARAAGSKRSPAEAAAAARPPLADSLIGQAKVDYEGARILFDDQDYAGALLKFQRAFDEAGDVRLLWNVAVCEKNLKHYASVFRLLDRYRHDYDVNMTEQEREQVLEVIRTVRTLITSVRIEIDEDDAAVSIDDKPIGNTPLTKAILVDLGERRIRATKPGWKPLEIVHNFAGGPEMTLKLSLRPEPREGHVSVIARETDTISVDGRVVGQGPWQSALGVGKHRLRVAAPGMLANVQEFELAAGQARTLYITLETESSGTPAWVWIGVGVLAAGGLATGAYFLARPSPTPRPSEAGSLGSIQLPLFSLP